MLVQWSFLAVIQGFTEFLPISSSAHLILPSQLLGWPDQGLAFDVAVHLGSLLAVLVYFYQILWQVSRHFCCSLLRAPHDPKMALQGWFLIVATLPAVAIGFLLKSFIETSVRDHALIIIATSTLLFGLLLWWADARATQRRGLADLRWKDAVCIGLAQALALIPGTSRSGITMTAGLMLGLTRTDAARFSFLLSIPLIIAAGSLLMIDLIEQPAEFDLTALVYGSVLSFISALACIVFFLKWLQSSGLWPFVAYRLLLGGFLFFVYFM